MGNKKKHPLDGIWAKLDRVDEIIKCLDSDVEHLLNKDPRPYEIFTEFKNNYTEYIIKAKGKSSAPLRFSVLSGEVLHHLRSSLDHLVVVLAEQSGQEPLRSHQFPVSRTEDKFNDRCRKNALKGISSSAKKLIKDAQPYNHNNPNDYTLQVIHELNNTDKHRLLLLAYSTAKIKNGAEIIVGSRDENKKDTSPIKITGFGNPSPKIISEDSIEVFRISLGKPEPNFYADCNIHIQIAFDKCGASDIVPVIPTLKKMAAFTRSLIQKFENEF